MSIQYYTHVQLRKIARERGVKLRTNTPRKELCELLNIHPGKRLPKYYGGERREVGLKNTTTDEAVILPSIVQATKALGFRNSGSTMYYLRKQKVVNVIEDVHHIYRGKKTTVKSGRYMLCYVN